MLVDSPIHLPVLRYLLLLFIAVCKPSPDAFQAQGDAFGSRPLGSAEHRHGACTQSCVSLHPASTGACFSCRCLLNLRGFSDPKSPLYRCSPVHLNKGLWRVEALVAWDVPVTHVAGFALVLLTSLGLCDFRAYFVVLSIIH